MNKRWMEEGKRRRERERREEREREREQDSEGYTYVCILTQGNITTMNIIKYEYPLSSL